MIVVGPVPSRRLGRSLGINNIPPKHCSYSCMYCQVGSTKATEIESRQFYQPQAIFNEVKTSVIKLLEQGESIDYLTFVPDGEPTLDDDLVKPLSSCVNWALKSPHHHCSRLIESRTLDIIMATQLSTN